MSSPERVREALRAVVDPCSAATGSNLDVVEMGLVKDVTVEEGHVQIDMRLTTPACQMIAYFIAEAERQVGPLPGVTSVDVTFDDGFEWSEEMLSEEAKRTRRRRLDERREAYGETVTAGDR